MQRHILLFLLIISSVACSQKKVIFNDYVASIKDYQQNQNLEFRDKNKSPLTEEDRKKFKGLDFFPIDSTYKVTAEFKLYENPKTFAMPTTTDRLPLYRTYGVAVFTLNGQKLALHVYQNQDIIQQHDFENHLFIPFNDETNGKETYGGGRFLDVEIPKGDTLIIDFNTAYNPYCAYNQKYSCPIPPKENDLAIAIKAGVKNYNYGN
ncbi:DUF1684 domain-containing protein [Aureibaculum sp. 2210JD6-5]|uniref:DUF1684 domain-containing protein n=1 Tax=Aureibaculum sp. 2210JD6-5 TaxID=3103957 RepID=UPI002AAD06AF|nr:DUF1684 domain-containing protein [Aureibaculum sp. 2210JD6-5]MDY7394431.1 DUF1684 domain-containing protein [Aureibaculum sp. 2210JD6-5]